MRASSCPSEDELVHFSTRDLLPPAAAKIQAHVSECAWCAAQLKEWDQTLEAYRRYTPGAGEDLPQWHGFNEALRQEESAWQYRRARRTRHQWTAAATIAATLLGAVWIWQRSEIVLNAEEAISRAVQQEQGNPSRTAASVWIRRTQAGRDASAAPTQLKDIDGTIDGPSQRVSDHGHIVRELAFRLARYGFNAAAPLSAMPLQRWRATAVDSQDTIQPIDSSLLKVSTTTTRGPIRLAEIVVRQHTYEPVSQLWQFADGLEVQLTSVRPDAPPPTAEPMIAAEAVRPAPPVDMEAVELDLRSSLQRLGAPVGSALTIRHARGGVHVEGVVDTTDTARDIEAYARGRRFVDARVVVRPVITGRDVAISAELRAWLDQTLRNDDIREAFVGHTWKLVDELKIRVAAFDELGRTYSKRRTTALSPDAQQKLADLAVRQYTEVTARYEALEKQLAPLIGTVSRPVLPSELPADWRQAGTAAKYAIEGLNAKLMAVLASPDADTPHALEQRARHLLRPSLEAVAAGIAGQSY